MSKTGVKIGQKREQIWVIYKVFTKSIIALGIAQLSLEISLFS